MFHIAAESSRGHIAEHGLTPKPRTSSEGVYVAEEPHAVRGVDIYAVDTSHLPSLVDDSKAMDRAKRSRLIPGSVSKDRVRKLSDTEVKALQEAQAQYRWKNPLA